MSAFYSQDSSAFARSPSRDADVKSTASEELNAVYQLDDCVSWIRENGYERTCLQFPETLLNDGVRVALRLEELLGWKVYVLADTAYGSCCVDHISAEHVKGDSIIHFGHACLSHFSKLPVLYIFEKEELDVGKFKNAVQDAIPDSNHVTIFYDVAYSHLYNDLCRAFESRSNCEISKIVLPESQQGIVDRDESVQLFGRAFRKFPHKNASCVFIGDDCSLLQNLALALPDMSWHYYSQNRGLCAYNVHRSKFLMKKHHQVELVKDAKVLGILIGTLGIENYLNAIDQIKQLAKRKGKKCYILAVGRPNVSKLANFPEVDVFVLIACSENVSKDFKEYYKPVVSVLEVQMALGDEQFQTEYINDFREALLKRPSESCVKRRESCEADVSLTSGRIRMHGEGDSFTATSMEMMEKIPGIVAEMTGADFLANRSWRGLEQNFEQQEVAKAVLGRSGIPLAYENEPDAFNDKK